MARLFLKTAVQMNPRLVATVKQLLMTVAYFVGAASLMRFLILVVPSALFLIFFGGDGAHPASTRTSNLFLLRDPILVLGLAIASIYLAIRLQEELWAQREADRSEREERSQKEKRSRRDSETLVTAQF